jgi:hypothetical protein
VLGVADAHVFMLSQVDGPIRSAATDYVHEESKKFQGLVFLICESVLRASTIARTGSAICKALVADMRSTIVDWDRRSGHLDGDHALS